MGRVKIYEKVRKDFWIMKAQDIEFRNIAKQIGKTQTQALNEALAYWLSAQKRMGING